MLRSRLLALVVLVVCTRTASAQEVSPQFSQFDVNKDGKLTREEVPGPVFDLVDTNKDGVVTAEEDQAFTRGRGAGRGQVRGRGAGAGNNLPMTIDTQRDIPYAGTNNPRHKLDLYLPKTRSSDQPLPVVVFIHGGAWQGGDKRDGAGTLSPLVASGDFIGVSVGYRLSGEAIWPAQIHDCKAAIRWIKGNAKKYNLDPERIGVTGPSAGGHLAAMLGTAGDVPELEGKLGEHLKENSQVRCVVDQFGPADLLSMGGFHNNADSPEAKLVGGLIEKHQEAARQASPTTHASRNDPPFLLIHGTADPLVPFSQSEALHKALKDAGVESTLVSVPGAGHGGFPQPQLAERLRAFFDKHLRGKDVVVSGEPIMNAR